jgi:hypothetical protein
VSEDLEVDPQAPPGVVYFRPIRGVLFEDVTTYPFVPGQDVVICEVDNPSLIIDEESP